MSKEKVLVTGATGFLGRHLVKKLCSLDYDVSILARKTSDLSPFESLPIKICYGDITNTLDLLQATEEKDIVFHLAGYIAYKKSDRKQMEKINVHGTRNVADACITNQVKKLFHLSSVVTIGASFNGTPLNEESPYNLSDYDLGYFETKKKAEEIIFDTFEEHKLPVYMINPATIYGAGDGTKGSRKTQIKVAKGEFKFYPPGGVNVVYVNDVIDSIFLVLKHGQPARRYIIGGDNLTIKELFEIIAETSGVPKPNIPIPRAMLTFLGWVGDRLKSLGKETSLSSETAVTSSLYHWFDSSRAIKELNFKPTPSRVAIKESISWMKQNNLLD